MSTIIAIGKHPATRKAAKQLAVLLADPKVRRAIKKAAKKGKRKIKKRG